jgi:hypothetical protein
MFLPQSERPSFAPIQHKRQNYSFVYLKFWFFDMRREDKRLWIEWQQPFPELILLLISSWMTFWFVSVIPKYLNFATFSNDSLAILIFWFCPEFWWWE